MACNLAPSNNPSTNRVKISQQYQYNLQFNMVQHKVIRTYLPRQYHKLEPKPLPYPAYPLNPQPNTFFSCSKWRLSPTAIGLPAIFHTSNIFSFQAAQPPQTPKARRVSRRVAITTIAVGAAAVAGSSLTYYAYRSTRNASSNIVRTIGSLDHTLVFRLHQLWRQQLRS